MKVSNAAGGRHSPRAFQDAASAEMDALQATRHGVFGRLFGGKKRNNKNHVRARAPAKGEESCDVIECDAPPMIIEGRASMVAGPPKGHHKRPGRTIYLKPIVLHLNTPETHLKMHYNIPGRDVQGQMPDVTVQGTRVIKVERVIHVGADTFRPFEGIIKDERTAPEIICTDRVIYGEGKGGTKRPDSSSSSSASSDDGGGDAKAPRKGTGYDTSSASSSSSSSAGKKPAEEPAAPRKGPDKAPENAPAKERARWRPRKASARDAAASSSESSLDTGPEYPASEAHLAGKRPKHYDSGRAGPIFPRRYWTEFDHLP